MNLRRASNVSNGSGPLYQQVKHTLIERLSTGAFAPGTALPSERDLAGEFSVSIGTLRTAVDALVTDGILVRQQGRGTFVAKHDQEQFRFYFFHVVKQDQEKIKFPDVRLEAFYIGKADSVVAEKLNIKRGAATINIRNVLWLDARPVVVDEIALSSAQFRGLTEASVRNRTSTLYSLYQAQYGITVVRSSERLRAETVTLDHARLLDVETGTPILQIRRVAMGYDEQPIEWRVSHVNTALHEYTSELGS